MNIKKIIGKILSLIMMLTVFPNTNMTENIAHADYEYTYESWGEAYYYEIWNHTAFW